MTKARILEQIRSLAAASGGTAPGQGQFANTTGIRRSDWLGVFWRSWSEAIREAGLSPNSPPPRIEDAHLLTRYAELARSLGHAPTKADLKLAKRGDQSLPSETTFINRFGSYSALRARACEHCRTNREFADVADILESASEDDAYGETDIPTRLPTGFVYLVRHGTRNEYKIGKTVNPIRREGEIRLQLPEKLNPIHYIETDDPSGIEAYWHARFDTKRKEGEWFALSREDVAAFKRWKRIV